ncbi:MAG: hypothetical protein J6L66_02470, partial [Anaerotignum sp.]|nr:hypothetical protein [Anaerotignum sp.]
ASLWYLWQYCFRRWIFLLKKKKCKKSAVEKRPFLRERQIWGSLVFSGKLGEFIYIFLAKKGLLW